MFLYNQETDSFDYVVLDEFLSYEDGVKTYSRSIPSEYLGKVWGIVLYVRAHGEEGPSSGQDWLAWADAMILGSYVLTMELDSYSVEVEQGQSIDLGIHLTGDYPYEVTFGTEDVPEGVQVTFNPESGTLPFDAVATFDVADDASPGTYSVKIMAYDTIPIFVLIAEVKTVSLEIEPKVVPDFSLDVSPSSITVTKGESAVYSISVAPSGGFDSSVSLSVSGLPSDVDYEFTPDSGVPPFASSLIIETSVDTPTGTFELTITGAGGGKSHSKHVTLIVEEQPDFTVDVEPGSLSLIQGESAEVTVEVTAIGGFGEEVELEVSDVPDGVSVTFSPESGVPDFTSNMTVEVSEEVEPGTYELQVVGSGGGKSHSALLTLEVLPMPDFEVSLSPDSMELLPGQEAAVTVSVEPIGGFEEEVELSAVDLPEGFDVAFDPQSGTPSFDAVMNLAVSEDVEPGTYHFRVLGESGEVRRYAAMTVEVKTPPDFSLTVSEPGVTVVQGESASITVSVEPIGGFSDPVALSVSNLPSKVSAEFSANDAPPPFTSTLTISVEEDAAPGSWDLVVEGVGGGLSRTVGFQLVIEEAPQPFDFELTASQTSLTLKPGQKTTIVITVDLVSGEPEPVALSVVGLPASISHSLTPSTITPTGAATLELTAGAEPGVYNFVVQGQNGGSLKTVAISLKVEEESRCLIATAAFGSEVAPQVQALREFRDGFVMKTFGGKQFMTIFNAFYYSWSPYMAEAERQNPLLRDAVKAAIYPLLTSLEAAKAAAQPFAGIPELAVLISGVVAGFLIGAIYVAPIVLPIALRRRLGEKLSKALPILAPAIMAALAAYWLAEITMSATAMSLASATVVLTSIAIGALTLTTLIGKLTSYKRLQAKQ